MDETLSITRLRERRKTHWIVRLVTPAVDEYREMPKTDTARKVFGFFPAEMLDGATIYAAGAATPWAGGIEVQAIPTWNGVKRG